MVLYPMLNGCLILPTAWMRKESRLFWTDSSVSFVRISDALSSYSPHFSFSESSYVHINPCFYASHITLPPHLRYPSPSFVLFLRFVFLLFLILIPKPEGRFRELEHPFLPHTIYTSSSFSFSYFIQYLSSSFGCSWLDCCVLLSSLGVSFS